MSKNYSNLQKTGLFSDKYLFFTCKDNNIENVRNILIFCVLKGRLINFFFFNLLKLIGAIFGVLYLSM